MSFPWGTVAVIVSVITAIVVLAITGHEVDIPAILGLMPGLGFTTYFAEKAARQTTNGHVKEAVKQGMAESIAEADGNDPIHG